METAGPLDDETLWGVPNKTAQDEGAMTQEEINEAEVQSTTASESGDE